MPINIISENLNTIGDSGRFETDRSTWLFGDTSLVRHVRSRSFVNEGTRSCRSEILNGSINITGFYIVPCSFLGVAGKKYLLRSAVRAAQTGPDASQIGITNNFTDLLKFSIIESINTTVGDAASAEQIIELKIVVLENRVFTGFFVSLLAGSALSVGGFLFTDTFEVFEYEDVVFDCTLAPDTDNIAITDETAASANDGMITMAVTGSQGAIEFRLNSGSWQSSSLFSGLAPGSYTLEVRETTELTCLISYQFAIQAFGSYAIIIEKNDETIKGAQDGSIVITPQGGTAPYQYSIDVGSSFQPGNSFSGLAPGSYAVVVQDNDSIQAVANVTIGEGVIIYDNVYFTKNPIPYSRPQTSNATELNYRIYNEVRVESSPGSNVFLKRIAMELEPELGGSTTFYLQQAFRAVFDPQPPVKSDVGNDLYKLTDRSAVYKNAYGDLFDDLEIPGSLTESGTFLVVYGGISKKQYPALQDYFTSWLPSNKKFMTWLPYGGIEIDRSQEFYLQYFTSGVPPQLKLLTDIFYDDQTSVLDLEVNTRSNIAYGDIYVIPCGSDQLALDTVDPTKTITSYRLWIADHNDANLTDKFTFKLTRFKRPNTRYFMYLNSLGAHEVLRCTGKASTKVTVQKDTMQQYLGHEYTALTPEVESFNASLQNSMEYSTGFLKGKTGLDYLKSLRDILLTTKFYDITDGTRKPLVVLAGDMNIEMDEEYRYYLRFKCAEPYVEESFTPDAI